MLIRSMQTNSSTINGANMITENPQNNTWLIINQKNKITCIGWTVFQEISNSQISGSMNADPINMIHISKKSTKEGLSKEIEVDFRLSKSINWSAQVSSPSDHTKIKGEM